MSRKRFNDTQRRQIGLACLRGTSAADLAREWGCSFNLVCACMHEVLLETSGYTRGLLTIELRLPGCGPVRAMRTVYERLIPSASMSAAPQSLDR